MRYVQINSFYNGSTGAVMKGLHKELQAQGHDSYIFWGRGSATLSGNEQRFSTDAGVYLHGMRARLTDRAGFYSEADTTKLLRTLDEIDPDIVHLHNLHGYYINIEMLFNWLKARGQQTRWTLHDCWAFTGHCPHFTYVKCEQWKTCCGCTMPCPQRRGYPSSFLRDNSMRNFLDKKRLFTSLSSNNLTIITPSNWLADLTSQSFLAKYPVEVHHNQIDQTVFKPTPSDFRERYGIGGRFMVLGVASPWTERKGLDDFERLAGGLDERFAIVIVGLNKKQIREFPENVAKFKRNKGPHERAMLHSAADPYARPGARDAPNMMPIGEQACKKHADTTGGAACADIADRPNAADSKSGFESFNVTIPTGAKEGPLTVLIRQTDSQDQLAALYSAADVLFNPTKEDNYPTVNLEAQACGTPVVTYDTGGCRETLRNKRSLAVSGYRESYSAIMAANAAFAARSALDTAGIPPRR